MLIPTPPAIVIDRLVRTALEEDIGRGDLTSWACIEPTTMGAAQVCAREPLVLSGLPVLTRVFELVDQSVVIRAETEDGASLDAGACAATIEGPAASILLGERVALNFAQRMSGVATMARRYVSALPEGTSCRIADTRKTTPGLRPFERYAVRCGGAHNHREDLSSAVMIKDNHIAACGGVREAIVRAKKFAPHTCRIECEVDTHEQLLIALDAGADIIMLDNFDDDAVRAAVAVTDGRAILEASGGITIERIPALARAGVDVISVGALTHSAPAVDLGLDWR